MRKNAMNFPFFRKIFFEFNLINKKINLFLIIFLSLIIFSYTEDDSTVCSFDIDCNNCNFCGEETQNYANCNYDNIFCKGENQYYFSSRLKNEYDLFFRKDEEINSFCGKGEVELNLDKESITILELNKNNFPKGKSVHCLYSFNNLEKYKMREPSIILEIQNIDKNLINNNIDFKIIIEHTNGDEEKIQKLITIDDFEENNIYEESLEDTEELLIFIDFLNINIEGDESIELKYIANKKIYFINLTSYILYGIIVLAFLIIFILLLIKIWCPKFCWKNSQNNQVRQIEPNRNQNIENVVIVAQKDIENEIRKKKINISKKSLKNDIFSDKLIQKYGNNCSICLEQFIKEKSEISITPCEHIFHMACIIKWIESNGSNPYCPNCKYNFINKKDKKKPQENPLMLMRNNNLIYNSNRRLNNNNEHNNSRTTI